MQAVIEKPPKIPVRPTRLKPRSKPVSKEPGLSKEPGPLHEFVSRAMQSSPYRAMRGRTCEYESGAVRLIGSVPSYFMKRLAEETVRQIAGVQRIENYVIVVQSDERREYA